MNLQVKNANTGKRKIKTLIEEENVCVLGLGYVGLTLALTLAEVGVKVTGIDKNKSLLDTLNQGQCHFYEKGLDRLLKKFQGDTFEAAAQIPEDHSFNVFIVSVGTPVNEQGEPNLSFVEESANLIGRHLKPESLVILRSTVPVGTTRNVVKPILEKISGLRAGEDFSLVFAPERTVEGSALKELRELPQIIGGIDEKSFIKASNLFRRTTPTVVNVSSLESAEMVKILDNTYRDLHFAISNEIALICEKLNLDSVECIRAANLGYNRTNIPVPSPGVGGTCLSKDPYILLDVTKKAGYVSEFIRAGRKINERMPVHVVERVKEFFDKNGKGKNAKVFVMGFAFKAKPVTSDTRNSPTIPLVKELKKVSSNLWGYDPQVSREEIETQFGVKYCSIEEGFKDADCVIIMLNSDMYTELDIFNLLSKTKKPVLFYDGWQLFKRGDLKNLPGVYHEGVGFGS